MPRAPSRSCPRPPACRWPRSPPGYALGESIADLRADGTLPPVGDAADLPDGGMVAVKEAVLPFGRFHGVDTVLGPEMRSTGEVMGLDRRLRHGLRQVADRRLLLGPAHLGHRVRLGGQPGQALDDLPAQASGRPRVRDHRHRWHGRRAAPQRRDGQRHPQDPRAGRRAEHRGCDPRRADRADREHPLRGGPAPGRLRDPHRRGRARRALHHDHPGPGRSGPGDRGPAGGQHRGPLAAGARPRARRAAHRARGFSGAGADLRADPEPPLAATPVTPGEA